MRIKKLLTSGFILTLGVAINSSVAQETTPSEEPKPPKHFDRVLIIVLENQSYVAAKKDSYLRQLADEGAEFTNFRGVGHPSYPNYLGMISGSTFGIHGILGDKQMNFPDDSHHKTVADLLDWRNYAEDYPSSPSPYLAPTFRDRTHNYARKHVPFLSFVRIQQHQYQNVVSVDPKDPHNSFVTDIANARKDPKDPIYKPLPQYILYTPNLDDDGHDTNLATASKWLKTFLETWVPRDARKNMLIVVTFDEGEPPEAATNHIYTVFLGDMIKKKQKIDHRYDHYSVLKTIEDNFGLDDKPLNVGDDKAEIISDVWN